MSDLISRRAMMKEFSDFVRKSNNSDFANTPTWNDAVSLVGSMQSVQPEPHEGHWIRRDCGLDVECKCSKCGYRDFVEPRDEYWFNRNFCPNCGAKMTISTK